jgi:hypothetical protein
LRYQQIISLKEQFAMTYKLNSFISWFVYDPRRVFMVLLAIALVLMVVAMVIPTHAVFAGQISGGSD